MLYIVGTKCQQNVHYHLCTLPTNYNLKSQQMIVYIVEFPIAKPLITIINHHEKCSFLPGVLVHWKKGFFGKGFLFQPSCEHVVDQSDLVPRWAIHGSLAQKRLVVKVIRRNKQLLMTIPSKSIYVLGKKIPLPSYSGDGMFRPSILL